MRSFLCAALLLASAVLPLTACRRAEPVPVVAPSASAPAPAFYAAPFERKPDVATLTALGRALFADPTLSASGRMSCASCHDPAHAFAPANALAVQLGGADGRRPGLRAVPSLTYRQNVPPFSEHFSDTDGDDSVDQGPTGGRDWDGRASSAHEQAAGPLLSPFEMANTDSAAVVARLQASPNAQRFRDAFGTHVLDDTPLAWNGLLLALEVYQQNPAEFYPYDSKYDAFLRGRAELTSGEQRGLALFNDPTKGNCAVCHPSAIKHGAFPQFTDHGFIAIGVPRNPQIPANADPKYVDLGLCGPLRTDLAGHDEYCGLFKTPSLRNVATRRVFFHNGVFHSLGDAVRFYVRRDVIPDLPERYRDNLNTDAPFDRRPGDKPALTEREIADVVAFLKTLTDGWTPPRQPSVKAARSAASAGSS